MLRGLLQRVNQLLTGAPAVDEALFDELQERLILSDVSAAAASQLVEEVWQEVRRRPGADAALVQDLLRESIAGILAQRAAPLVERGPEPPLLYLVVGVNGTGKTTTIAKLAHRLQAKRATVLLAAADTFRAAAIDQLRVWAERLRCDIVAHSPGSDPAAAVFDAVEAARARGVGCVIADTAGRLHTKRNLMEELRKVERVATRALGRPPDESLLVLDATTGQNALVQAQDFSKAVRITGLVLTKLDGTAKGGALVTLAREMDIPIKLVGTGEDVQDLADFDPRALAEDLIGRA